MDGIDKSDRALDMVHVCRSAEDEAKKIRADWEALIARVKDAAAKHPDFAEAFNFTADALNDIFADYMLGEIYPAINGKNDAALRDLPEGVRRDAAEGMI